MSKRFKRQESWKYKRLDDRWRKARGAKNPYTRPSAGKPAIPRDGYGKPPAIRGLHPSGLEDIVVNNVDDVKKIDAKTQGIRIAATVGNKKRYFMQKQAEKLKIRVFNLKKIELREKKK